MSLRVLHVIPSVAVCRGGPSKAVIEMVRALNQRGIKAEIATTNDACENCLDVDLNNLTDYQGTPTRFFARWSPPISGLKEFQYSGGFKRWLKNHISDYDLIHIHAIFSFCSSYAMSLARKNSIPYVARPIGQLDDWSLQQKAFKKKLYLKLSERKNLRYANLVHFTAETEKTQAIANVDIKPSVVIPLGIEVQKPMENAAVKLRENYDIPKAHKIIAYVARIHKKKGLELLIQALAKLDTKNITLLIAGDGDKSYLQSLTELAEVLELKDRVKWLGFLEGEQKNLVLQGADLFALTSYSENFGIAVLEALSAGTPALVSRQVALSDQIMQANIGAVCDTTVKDVAKKLKFALQNSTEVGEPARAFVAANYQWSDIADTLISEYKKLLA